VHVRQLARPRPPFEALFCVACFKYPRWKPSTPRLGRLHGRQMIPTQCYVIVKEVNLFPKSAGAGHARSIPAPSP